MKIFIPFLFLFCMLTNVSLVHAQYDSNCPSLRIVANCGFPEINFETGEIIEDTQCDPCTNDFTHMAVQILNEDTGLWEYATMAGEINWFDAAGVNIGTGVWIANNPSAACAILSFTNTTPDQQAKCKVYVWNCDDPEPCDDEPVEIEGGEIDCVQCPATGVYHCSYKYCVVDPQPGLVYTWSWATIGGDPITQTGECVSFNLNSGNVYILTLTVFDPERNCYYIGYEREMACTGGDCEVLDCPFFDALEVDVTQENSCEYECVNGFPSSYQATCNFSIAFDLPAGCTARIEMKLSENPGSMTIVDNISSPFLLPRSCGSDNTQTNACQASYCIQIYGEDFCLKSIFCGYVACDPVPCFYEALEACADEVEPRLQDTALDKKSVYPNPISLSQDSRLYLSNDLLQAEDGNLNIQLINASGKLIKSRNNGDNNIDLAGLAGGIYFLRIESAQGDIQLEKIIVLE